MPNRPPPADFTGSPRRFVLAAGTLLTRIHSERFHATAWKPVPADRHWGGGRFDATEDDPFPFLYASSDDRGAISEALLRTLPSDAHGIRVFPQAALAERKISWIRPREDLDLVTLRNGRDLAAVAQDTWLTKCRAGEYAFTRRWGHQIRIWAPWAHGFVWRSRREEESLAYVFFGDRYDGGFEEVDGWRLDRDPGARYVRMLLAEYRVAIQPVGTGVGAVGTNAAGGTVGTGAAVGTAVAGPVGGIIGAAVGAVVGGLAGKAVAEAFDPTGEDLYWRENYKTRGYVSDEPYETYRPAYAYGWNARRRSLGATWEEIENDLESGWERFEDKTELTWERAKNAVQDGWNRVENSFDRMFKDEDEYWRENYSTRPYYRDGLSYDDDYRPAYELGWRQRLERLGDKWEDVENDMERGWERFKAKSKLNWLEAKDAVRDGWHQVERWLPGDFDRDLS